MMDDFREEHEFEDIDKDKLEEFERELAGADKKKKKKFYLIAGGTAICAAALLFFSGWLDQPASTRLPVKVKTAPQKPQQAEPQPAQPDAEMAAIQQKNIVEEDSKAPGIVAATPAPATGDAKTSAGSSSAQETANKPGGIILLAAATLDGALATSARDDLNAKGFKSWISIGKVKESVFVVEVGEFNSVKDAEPSREKLSKAGFDTHISQSGARTVLVAGVFLEKAGADVLAGQVKSAGFSPKALNRKEPSDLYLVRVGPYNGEAEAQKAGEAIKAAGYAYVSSVQ